MGQRLCAASCQAYLSAAFALKGLTGTIPAALLFFYKTIIALALGLLLAACARKNYGLADARPPAEAGQPLPPGIDSVRNLAAGWHYNQHGGVFCAFFGRHYRRVWAAPVTAPVFNLTTAAPGGQPLRPGKPGGGYQSITLTLNAPTGREFTLRTLDKDPRKTLPLLLRRTFLLNAVRDATSAANPYAALVVPPLAEAAGLTVGHPRLVYVRPDETALGTNSARFQGKLALLEEKFEGQANLIPALAGASALINTKAMLGKLEESPVYQVNQAAFLRARLLDIWLGDWDRHARQWEWAAYPGSRPGSVRYRPIPKDRDQVFYRFDGALPWLVSRPFIAPKFQTFEPRYGNVRGLVKQARHLDQQCLSQLTRADFTRAAARLQACWPDTLIERAMRRFPPAVYALEGHRTAVALRQRRTDLPAAADQFYRILARNVEVSGSNRAEHFVVQRWADSVAVSVYDSSGRASSRRYSRTFRPAETRQIKLQGLGGNDTFTLTDMSPARNRRICLLVLDSSGRGHRRLKPSSRLPGN